jgi:Ca2+-transporting ATPase
MEKYSGLSEEQALELLKKYGKNEIKGARKNPAWKIFLLQFTSPLILLLIAAAAISYFLASSNGESAGIDTILILLIVFASGIAGFFQEYKADKAIEALKGMSRPKCIVIREGRQKEIFASDIVQGDIIVLESGDMIPADSKIIEGNLDIDESILTGESRDVKKKPEGIVFSGTMIHSGRALAIVEKTGMSTEIGKLAKEMQVIKEEVTPFQIQMQSLGNKIFYFVIALVLLLVAVRYFKFGGGDIGLSLLIAVSLAVAAIPESLPAVITICLSNGARTMARKNALVRKLSVVE